MRNKRRYGGTGKSDGDNFEVRGVSGHRNVTSGVSEGVDADDTIVAFAPRIPPHVQPFANASGESSTRRTASRVLSSGVLFLSNDGVSYSERKS
jgi:hypothetical protein